MEKYTNEYIEKLREYKKATEELRAYIEENGAGSYWADYENLFTRLGKTMHYVDQEIYRERLMIKSDEDVKQLLQRKPELFFRPQIKREVKQNEY